MKSTVDPPELVKNRKILESEMVDKFGYLYCQRCQKSKAYKFEVHHIIFRSRAPKHPMLHDKVNLIILCSRCHDIVHEKPSENEVLINQRNLRKIFYGIDW